MHSNGSVSLGLADGVEPGSLADRWLDRVGGLQIGPHVCADPVPAAPEANPHVTASTLARGQRHSAKVLRIDRQRPNSATETTVRDAGTDATGPRQSAAIIPFGRPRA